MWTMKYAEFKKIVEVENISKFQKTLKVVNCLFVKNTNCNMTQWYNQLLNKFIFLVENEDLNDSKTLVSLLDIYKKLFIRCKMSNSKILMNTDNNINLNVA